MLSDTNRARWKKITPILWIIAGSLFLFPSLFGASNFPSIAIGLMFIIFGIVFARKNKDDSADPENK